MAVFITPVEITPATADAWVDADVSADVPAGATGVILHCVNTETAFTRAIGFRKNGSTDDRTTSQESLSHFWCAIGVDASRILELYIDDLVENDVYLVGYYTSDASFFTNAIDKSFGLGDTAVWLDIDISADTGTDTAIGAVFEAIGGLKYVLGFRNNGSTDNRATAALHIGAIIGVDAAEICEGYAESTAIDFFLVGYILSASTFNINATDISLAVTAAWTDLAALPTGAIGGYIEVINAGAGEVYGLRKNGSIESIIYDANASHAWGIVEADVDRIIEGNIELISVDFFVVGYPTAVAAVLDQKHFIFYNDDGTVLNDATAWAAEDTNITGVPKGTNFRPRFSVANTGGTAIDITRRLEWRIAGGTWAAIAATGAVILADSAKFLDGDATTNRLTLTGTFTAGQGKDTGSDTTLISLINDYCVEDEWCVVFDATATDGATYEFRITNAGIVLDAYTVSPTATVFSAIKPTLTLLGVGQ